VRRLLVVAVLALVVLTSCTHGSAGRVAGSGASSTPSASLTPIASPARLPAVVLRADQSGGRGTWTLLFTVPFGPEKARLLYRPPSQSVPTEPTAFAVAADGSIWIVDAGKSRLAHFDATGGFLGDVRTPGRPPADLVFSGGRLYVLLDGQIGTIAEIEADGSLTTTVVQANERALKVLELFPAPTGVVVLSAGYAASSGPSQAEGPVGYAQVAASGSGRAELLSGLPIGRGTMVNLSESQMRPDEDFELTYWRSGPAVIQPVNFKLLIGEGSRAKRIPGVFGPVNPLPVDGDVPMYVMVSPSKPADQERYGGSRWFLRMGRSAVLWERLPGPGIPDEAQHRHIAAGPDGGIYLMVLTKEGAQIYRRP
jgi:hypothetical protein